MTVIVGVIALLGSSSQILSKVTLAMTLCQVMTDMPSSAKFLTPEERAYVIWRKRARFFW